jgi:hypothetical protein
MRSTNLDPFQLMELALIQIACCLIEREDQRKGWIDYCVGVGGETRRKNCKIGLAAPLLLRIYYCLSPSGYENLQYDISLR